MAAQSETSGAGAASWQAGAAGDGSGSGADLFDEHPEFLAAGAFAGGLALALILRWLGPDD